MTTLTLSDPVNDTTADADVIANNNAAIKAVVNGSLDSNNLKPSANILASQLFGFPNDVTKALLGDGSWAVISPILARDVTLVDVTSTAAETNLVNYTIPGGTLGTNKTLHVELYGDYLRNDATNGTTVRLYVGGIKIYEANWNATSSATRRHWHIDFDLRALNATNAQTLHGIVFQSDLDGTLNPTDAIQRSLAAANFALDSTVGQVIRLTAQPQISTVNLSARKQGYLVRVY